MKHREKEWGPFTFLTSTPGTRRRFPWVGRVRVTTSEGAAYTVGMWLSWLGRQVSVCRNRWPSEKATWCHQLTCLVLRRHVEVTVTGDATHSPFENGVMVVPERTECSRCGLILTGARWVVVT